MAYTVLGIRHHGPGSARAVRRALADLEPDIVLIEGPPEADAIVSLAGDPDMVPPVALLAYSPASSGAPAERRAAFWPFAEFSPEWQAIRYALGAGIPVRFCDLPAVNQLAEESTPLSPVEPKAVDRPPAAGDEPANAPPSGQGGERSEASAERDPSGNGQRASSAPPDSEATAERDEQPDSGASAERDEQPEGGASAEREEQPDSGGSAGAAARPGSGESSGASQDAQAPGSPVDARSEKTAGALPGSVPDRAAPSQVPDVRVDPLGWLAEAAGYDDAERWWEDVVEHRGEGPSPFEAIGEAMAELRRHVPADRGGAAALREERREAHMRKVLRRALKEGYERVAVVCGAWHVPAISTSFPVGKDEQILRGMPKVKVEMTWVPWTHGRLAGWSGYGAGVSSPGWYHHLFTVPDRPIERWLTAAARLLREEDLPVSSAHVIEAVRLADTLAALRDRPLAGLDEVTEACRAVLCEGADLPLELIQRRMVVGERLGAVPDSTPMVPLQRDLQAERRRLKLPASALEKEYRLDLRKQMDLDRSRLLHRLRLLDIAWGAQSGDNGSKGTFRETWTLLWRPEFDVATIEASVWGTSVHGAASAKAASLARDLADGDGGLPDLTSLAERCLLADLGDALPDVMRAVGDRAAADTDVIHLMAALPPLVRALRYGDVRGTPVGPLRTVVDALVTRIGIGLPVAVSGVDDDAARLLLRHVDQVNSALALLADETHTASWRQTLAAVVDRHGLHGLLEGRLTRLLRDAGRLPDVETRMARAVSVGEAPSRSAAWVEGFLSGGGLVLVHDTDLLRLVDAWIAGLPDTSFTDVLPLLRRTFSEFEAPERRSIGDRVRTLGGGPAPETTDEPLDESRAALAARTVLTILGRKP